MYIMTCLTFAVRELSDFIRTYHVNMAQLFVLFMTSINVQEKILKNPLFKSTIFFQDVY
jgi:hypothetical protein